jgi:predicted Zn-dependent protease
MGIERELARDLLAKVRRQGATEADLLIVETDSSATQVRLREIESLKSAQERRLHLRVMFGKSSAATSTWISRCGLSTTLLTKPAHWLGRRRRMNISVCLMPAQAGLRSRTSGYSTRALKASMLRRKLPW